LNANVRTVLFGLLLSPLALLAAPPAAAQGFVGVVVQPAAPTTFDPLEITVAEYSGFDPEFAIEPLAGDLLIVRGTYSQFGGVPIGEDLWQQTFVVGPLPAGTYTVEFHFDGRVSPIVYRQTVTVTPPSPVLSLHDGRFRVRVGWVAPFGPGAGTGFAEALSDESGFFWFFGPSNVEVTIKILDGRPVNGHFWVFIANMSTVEFTVTVEDCPPEGLPLPSTPRTYRNPPSENRNFIDTRAF
jgi:hypothetical protein